RLELLVILEDQPEACRTEVIDLGKIQFNPMAARADGVVDGLAKMIGPRGVKPAPQPQFELFMALCPDDFHGLRWSFELILGRNCFVGILTRSHAGPLRRNFGARLCRPRPAAARRGVLGPWKFPRAAAGLRHSRAAMSIVKRWLVHCSFS